MQRFLIVGGGIAGLALAAGLRRRGTEVVVVERAPKWAPLGAGIVLSVNAMAALRSLGLAERVAARGHRLERMTLGDRGGRALSGADLAAIAERFGPTCTLHRADLHEALLEPLDDVDLRLGTTLAALHDDGAQVQVRFHDGREARFDALIGADGVRSHTRSLLFGEICPRYAGYTCWRLVVERPPALRDAIEMWGRGTRFGLVPLRGERVYGFAVANAPVGEADATEGRVARFRARFADFGGAVPDVLEQVRAPEQLIHNDLEEVTLPAWSRGRAALVGDAAHAMTPNMGQGAGMALEDAAVLCAELARGDAPDAVFRRWETLRRPRVDWVQRQSWRIGKVAHWTSAPATRLRDTVMRLTPARAANAALLRLASAEIGLPPAPTAT